MSKKRKNAASVIITMIVTLIILAGLSYAGVKFLLPYYLNGQTGSDEVQTTIYQFAVRVFPLLIGLVLIVIASMIATNHDDEEDDDDKLPPNSYENQFFDVPSDDPEAGETSRFTPEEEEEFVSIFDSNDDEVEPVMEQDVVEEVELPEEADDSEIADEENEEPLDEKEESIEEPKDNALIGAINALVNKLDKMTDLMSYEEEDEIDDEDEEIDDFEELDSSEISSDFSALESKIDSLCNAVSELTKIVANQVVVSAQPVVEEKQVVVAEPEEASVEEDSVEEDSVEEEPIAEEVSFVDELPSEEPVEEISEEEVAPVANAVTVSEEDLTADVADYPDCPPAERFARIEFDSAMADGYDISFVFTDASLDDVNLNLAGLGDAYEVNGKTMVIVPFLSSEEISSEFDKLGAAYECKTISANDGTSFEDSVGKMMN